MGQLGKASLCFQKFDFCTGLLPTSARNLTDDERQSKRYPSSLHVQFDSLSGMSCTDHYNCAGRKPAPLRESTLDSTKEKGLGNTSLQSSGKRAGDSLRKTPSKTPKKITIRTPSKSVTRNGFEGTTPHKKTPGGSDRFIPNRSRTDFEVAS